MATHRSVKELATSITHWVGAWNDDPRPYVWHKTADEIFDSLAFDCQRISESGHSWSTSARLAGVGGVSLAPMSSGAFGQGV
jgi:hypothetical protein